MTAFVSRSFALLLFLMPLMPSFIELSDVSVPGVQLVPRPVALAFVALTAAIVGVAAVLMWRERAPRSPIFAQLAAYFGMWAVCALLGLDPATGLLFAFGGVMFLIGHQGVYCTYRAAAPLYFASFLAGGLIASAFGIWTALARFPASLTTAAHGRAISTFIVPGEFAGYLLMLIPVAIGVAVASRVTPLRALAAVTALAGCAALVLTFSRAAWIGLAIGAAFALAVVIRSPAIRIAGAVAIVGLAVALAVVAGHHNPSENFTRLAIWRGALRGAALFPLTGVGPGAFRHLYPLVRPPDGQPDAFHAHSYVLTALVETGIAGVATLAALWWAFARAVAAGLAVTRGPGRFLAIAICAGFVATFAQSAFDFIQVLIFGVWWPMMALAIGASRDGLAE